MVSDWSGGQTTQLYIFPEGTDFKQRTFDFRISSATFTATESEFSDFTGYRRYLFPLQGWLSVNHDKCGETVLKPYQVNIFSGSSKTHSRNSEDCRDFNFIVREDLENELEIRNPIERTDSKLTTHPIACEENSITCVFSTDAFLIESSLSIISTSVHTPTSSVSAQIRNEIPAGGLYVCHASLPCSIKIKPGKDPVVICRVKQIPSP